MTVFQLFVFRDSFTHFDMAMSRIFNFNEKTSFTGDSGDTPVAFASFQHADRDIALDPLSTNRQLHMDIGVLGTVIVAGSSPESMQIIVPDCLVPRRGVMSRSICVMWWNYG